MRRVFWFLLLTIFVRVSVAENPPETVTRKSGKVNAALAPYEIQIFSQPPDSNGFSAIDKIEIHTRGKQVQTIEFGGEERPLSTQAPAEMVSLKDVDFDGYKDLLVLYTTGVHGDSWYHLYRFDPKNGSFIRYPKFSELGLQQIDLQQKVIKTYVNSGMASCYCESGTYRWEMGELAPLRIESQGQGKSADTLERTITTWKNGKESTRTVEVPGNDCHRKVTGP